MAYTEIAHLQNTIELIKIRLIYHSKMLPNYDWLKCS